MRGHLEMRRQRHPKGLRFRDHDKVVRRISRRWGNWLVRWDLHVTMDGRVLEGINQFTLREILTGDMRLYCMCFYDKVDDSDVIGDESELLITVYDRQNQENFLGHLKMCPKFVDKQVVEQWFKLEPRTSADETVTGDIKLYWSYESVERKHLGPQDFDVLRLIGRGSPFDRSNSRNIRPSLPSPEKGHWPHLRNESAF
jgi:hypothetical protein